MVQDNYPIERIRGITTAEVTALTTAGVGSTRSLLEACGARSKRAALAARAGVDGSRLQKLANRADLMRIAGIGRKWSDLLEHAGVDTVRELATRNADNLQAKLAEVNAVKHVVDAVPMTTNCASWIAQAKALEPELHY